MCVQSLWEEWGGVLFLARETGDWGAIAGTRRGELVAGSGWREPDKGMREDSTSPNWPQPPDHPDPLPQKLRGQLDKGVSRAHLCPRDGPVREPQPRVGGELCGEHKTPETQR